MSMAPTPEQMAAQVAMIRRRRADDKIIGMHTPGPWLGGSELDVDGERLPVVFCVSALHVSAALMAHDADGPPLVIIANLDDGSLSLDALARLAGNWLYRRVLDREASLDEFAASAAHVRSHLAVATQTDRMVTTFLSVLEAHDGHMTRHGLAQALGQPDVRLPELLARLQRLLNVDGYQVVAVDEICDTVALDWQLLATHFQVVAP